MYIVPNIISAKVLPDTGTSTKTHVQRVTRYEDLGFLYAREGVSIISTAKLFEVPSYRFKADKEYNKGLMEEKEGRE